MTSPPYWRQRDYRVEGQIGQEVNFQDYVRKIIEVFHEVKRVLKPTASLYLNLGDKNAGSGGAGGDYAKGGRREGKDKPNDSTNTGLPNKCMIGLPERIMLGLIDDGWILRRKIVWEKPNAMASSLRDNYGPRWEPVYFFTKNGTYFFNLDGVRVPHKHFDDVVRRMNQDQTAGVSLAQGLTPAVWKHNQIPTPVLLGSRRWYFEEREKKGWQDHKDDDLKGGSGHEKVEGYRLLPHPLGKNPGDVWSVSQVIEDETHFATFPADLVIRPLKASCPEGGVILDPFAGSGTVAKVAKENTRSSISIEIKPEYVERIKAKVEFGRPTLDGSTRYIFVETSPKPVNNKPGSETQS